MFNKKHQREFSEAMPERTNSLMHQISSCGGIGGFVLIGGTALAVHLRHRLSEDLDFCCSTGLNLNRDGINNLLKALSEQGSQIQSIVDVKAQQDFLIDGEDILDFHQTYIINGVKVDFFVVEDGKLRERVCNANYSEMLPGIKIADINLLADLKSNVILKRQKSRDFYDIKTLIERELISFEDVLDSMKSYTNGFLSEEYLLARLSPNSFHQDDEGFEGLVFDRANEEVKSSLIDFFKIEEEEYKMAVARGSILFEP